MKIPYEDMQIRECSYLDRGYTVVIASARYCRAIKVLQEEIDDFGSGVIELAKSQATALLAENPIAYRVGEEIYYERLTLPEPPK